MERNVGIKLTKRDITAIRSGEREPEKGEFIHEEILWHEL